MPAPDPALAARLRLAVTRLARRLRQESESPVSPTQVAVLATVEREGPVALGRLAELEQVRPPTVTAAVTRLEDQGLVLRRDVPADRRVTEVEVTASGRQLLERARSRKTAYLDRRLRGLTGAERSTLEEAVDVLEQLLGDER